VKPVSKLRFHPFLQRFELLLHRRAQDRGVDRCKLRRRAFFTIRSRGFTFRSTKSKFVEC
jgi:hypothetical protein